MTRWDHQESNVNNKGGKLTGRDSLLIDWGEHRNKIIMHHDQKLPPRLPNCAPPIVTIPLESLIGIFGNWSSPKHIAHFPIFSSSSPSSSSLSSFLSPSSSSSSSWLEEVTAYILRKITPIWKADCRMRRRPTRRNQPEVGEEDVEEEWDEEWEEVAASWRHASKVAYSEILRGKKQGTR